ncbi:ATP-binding protein [Bradyrhizobium sp. Arg816]|uniref:ATP-binding protein n=1 Tax=Bradyrhizobium sp. Arg816 TaxID=2998491 RepID=UPI00249E1671|nr:ATP-binding protein [Bradyrhizobium sp. Arg816]MDI3560158.1 ATP-binding protein [Bradyrhizobium sp. Arg816]
MTADTWLDGNNAYLTASLAWLRAKLRLLAPPDAEAPSAPTPPPSGGMFGWRRHPKPQPAPPTRAAPAVAALPKPDIDREAAEAAAARQAAAKLDPPPALILLERRLGLSSFERDTLLMCAAAELDTAMPTLFAQVRGGTPARAAVNPALGFPTFALALQTLDEPSWDALSPHRPLRYARLLEVNQSGATPLTASPIRADERIVNYIKGLNVLDERVANLAAPVRDAAAPTLAASQQAAANQVLRLLRTAADTAQIPPVHLLGSDSASKAAVARQVATALNRRLHKIDLEAITSGKAEIDQFATLWSREAVLLPLALYIDADELDPANVATVQLLQRLVGRGLGLLFVALREAQGMRGLGAGVEVERPTPQEQHEAWTTALASRLGDATGQAADWLAGQFDLNLPDIAQAAAPQLQSEAALPAAGPSASESTPATGTPLTEPPTELPPDPKAQAQAIRDHIWDACRAMTRPRLDALAERLTPKATWDDLVVSDEAQSLLRQIADQVRARYVVYETWGYARKMSRGLGISVLFSGESGTGKTMAAEVLANELRLDLFRIDLSAVVSKYIGETEKNLRRLFDAAERGGAILLFDEADALFGKRSEVKDSHDRYANIEINYLLQRMEAFSGLAILASNMKSALDSAFMRRLRFIVTFPFPGAAERKRIWSQALPKETPQTDLDFDRLARFSLSGGNIHSIALNASFLAARRAGPVTMPLLMSATRSELRKLDKPVNEAEFR